MNSHDAQFYPDPNVDVNSNNTAANDRDDDLLDVFS